MSARGTFVRAHMSCGCARIFGAHGPSSVLTPCTKATRNRIQKATQAARALLGTESAEQLAALVPKPRVNLIRFHGALLRASYPTPFGSVFGCSESLPAILSHPTAGTGGG
jgi:hypothetical protein